MQTGCLRPDVHRFPEARDHLFTYLPTWKVYPWVFALSSLDVSAINSHRWMVQLRKSALLIIIITFVCNETGLSLLSSVYHRHRLPTSFFCIDPLQNNELSCRDNPGTFHDDLSSWQGNHTWRCWKARRHYGEAVAHHRKQTLLTHTLHIPLLRLPCFLFVKKTA
jgi:hypothetical protein